MRLRFRREQGIPSSIPADRPSSALAQLAARLADDRATRFFLTMHERYRDLHLKNLIIDDADDQRHIVVNDRRVVNFGSDSFLGLDRDLRVRKALADGARRWGSHSGASRAFYSYEVSAEAERRLARWLGVEDTLIYPSTTLLNMGVLPAVAERGDVLIVDRQAHNSVQEGAQLARQNGATVESLHPCIPDMLIETFARNPSAHGRVVAVDGVYSMSGQTLPLREFDQIARKHGGILYIDDAHGTGVIGERGRGVAARELGTLENVLMVGSLSKAFSCMGAFITCNPQLKLLLQMKSSTYIFGGPVPPPYLEAICVVCDILESPEYDVLRERLNGMVKKLVTGATSLGFRVLGGQSPIVSLAIGDVTQTFQIGRALFDRGYYIQSVSFPAVPFNESLLRIQVNANHPPEAIDGLLNALADVQQDLKPSTDRAASA